LKILIVEDHRKINDILTKLTRGEGYHVVQAYDGGEALEELSKQAFNIVITDLMLPSIQGEDLIRQIRKQSDIYILVISAKTDLGEKIDVLKLGADDYLTKPFSVQEVMVKLANLKKRLKVDNSLVISFYQDELVIKTLERKVLFKNKELTLTKYEYDVLLFLIKNPNQVLSRDQIISALNSDSEAYDRVIDVYIKNIRRKLEDKAKTPRYIKTYYGLGYEFIGEQS
jgi:DNA-binding response OmpR family regulator